MSLRSDYKVFAGLVGVIFGLSACSSAPFPEIVEEDDYSTASSAESGFDVPVRKRTLKESSALTADEEHIAYEGQETPKKAKKTAEGPEKAVPAKTKPVIVAEDLDVKEKPAKKEKDSLAALDDKKFRKELQPSEKLPKKEENVAPSVTYLAGTIYFNNGSAAVDASYNRQLREIVRLAKANKATLNVFGYASSRTRNTDIVSHKMANFKVSAARAENVANALRRAGMPASRIRVEALSDSNPAYLEVMPEGERLNRRAEIYISY